MITSEKTDMIAPALIKAHEEMAPVHTDTENAFLKTKYASLAGVIKTITPAFRANGMTLLQGIDRVEGGAVVTTRVIHESSQFFEMSCPVPMGKMDGHALGSGVSYARRYSLLAFAGVAPEDDDGNAASNIKSEDRRDKDALMAITDTQLKEANRLLKILDATEDNIAATVRLFTKDRTESVEGMMKPEAEAIIKALRKRVAKDKSAV
jgi:hypothetical protein